MSLDFSLMRVQETTVFDTNITHNLGKMAHEAGIYNHLWHPENIGVEKAEELIAPLESGLARLKKNPAKYRKFDAPNGWGTYEHFVPFVEKVLTACKKYPDARPYTDT